jgi:HK97 family phage major capsid protein
MAEKIALLNDELEQLRGQRETLRNKHRGDTMPEDARAEDEELINRMSRVTKAIEVEKQRERDAAFANTSRYMDDPHYQVSRAVNDDDEGRRILAKAGWETKGGFITRMTSMGKELAMYPQEVLYGAIPSEAEDPVAAKYYKQTRAIMQPEYRNAFTKWMRDLSRNDSLAYARLTSQEQNALSEGVDGSGGFMVPPDIQAEMLMRTAQESVMTRLCRVVPTSRDVLRWNALKANASSGSIYSSGFVGGWVGETPAFSETDPTFEQFDIPIRKARVATKLSNDWLSDAAGNMLAMLAQDGGTNLGLVRDNGFIAGTGASNQPLGLLNGGSSTVDVEGSTTDTISNTVSNAGSVPKIIGLVYELPAQYSQNASVLMCRGIEADIARLVAADGRPAWQLAGVAGLSSAMPRTIEGLPIYNSDFVPDGGTNANKVLIVGDFRNYIIGQRTALSVTVLRERFADTDQTGIIIFERVGGGVWNNDAFRFGIV